MANESVNDVGSSQMSAGEGGDIKTVKDTRALIAEKNVPRTIKNLNRIFYIFIILFLAIIGLLIYFSAVNRMTMREVNTAIKVTNARHSTLAEINYFVRKLHSIGIELLTYGTTQQAQIDYTKTRINAKSNQLQQFQFDIGEATRTMKDSLNKEVSVSTINNYAQTNPGQIDVIKSGYESTLFQYTAETFQVNNATMNDIKQAHVSGATLNDTTRNILKAFAGIFYNGLRDLRSAALKVSDEVYTIYVDEIERSFLIYILTLSCIGMGLVVIGTALLVPTVFKVMRTTRLVITLFGMIDDTDIVALTNRCERFTEEYLNEGEFKQAFEDEADKGSGHDKETVGKDNLTAKGPEVAGLGSSGVHAKKEEEDNNFDIKTEKLPTLNGAHGIPPPETLKKPLIDEDRSRKDAASEHKRNLLNNGVVPLEEKAALKGNAVSMQPMKMLDSPEKPKTSKEKRNRNKKLSNERKVKADE